MTNSFVCYVRYVELNVKCHDGYRAYNEELPKFLHNRPARMVTHIMKRWESDIKNDMVRMISSGIFNVQSSTGENQYRITFGDNQNMPNCTCLDWRHNKLLCKHFCACMKFFPEWGWEKLANKYKTNVLFSLDETIVPAHNTPPQNLTVDARRTPPRAIINYNDDFAPLPPKRTSGKNALRLKCRNLMKELSGLTFLIDDKQQLSSLANDLQAILEKTRKEAPHEAGIIIQTPYPKKNPIKERNIRTKTDIKKKRNIATLTKRSYGRPKHPYTGRVGKHAEIMRKNYKVHVPLVAENPKKRKLSKAETIELSSSSKKPCKNLPPKQPWVCLANLTLSLVDKTTLISGNLLNDNHINAAQVLLKNQFSHIGGFTDTLLVSYQHATGIKSSSTSVSNITQIHNLPGHWLVSQSHGQSVIVYDSLYPGLTRPLRDQLVYVYKSLAKVCLLQVKLRCCQKQSGFVDCGLFAIANAVALAQGIYPGAVIFEQSQMRQHLQQCLEKKEITMFPHEVKKQPCHIREKSLMIKC